MSTNTIKQHSLWKRFQKASLVLLMTVIIFLSGMDLALSQDESVLQDDSALAQVISEKKKSDKNLMSINFTNVTLEKALEILADRINVGFSYNPDVMPNKIVSFEMRNVQAHEIIYKLLEGTNLEPVLPPSRDVIILREKEARINLEMFQETVTGTVTDAETGESLPGVNVIVVDTEGVGGSTVGTTTNTEGYYEIDVPDDFNTLAFTYVGYQRLEVNIDGRDEINVQLASDVQLLDDIVVVGYGTQERVNLTGSLEQVSSEKFENRTATNVSQMLQGASPGLTLSAPNTGLEPGAEFSIQVRGRGSINGSPEAHVIIDGVEGDLNSLNPNDIESITVLKDAAASAVIGSSAPFGVIMVTTKKGRSGKPSVSYNGNFQVANPINVPDRPDSYTFARAMNEAGINGGGIVFNNETVDRIIAFQNDPTLPEIIADPDNPNSWVDWQRQNGNNDWFDLHYGEAYSMKHNLSVSGGTENVSYYLSGALTDEDGIVNFANNSFKRNNFNGRVDADVFEWLNLRFNTRFMDSDRIRPYRQGNLSHGVMFHQISRIWPNVGLKTPQDDVHFRSMIPWLRDSGEQRRNIREFNQTIAADIRLSSSLSIDADFSFRTRNRREIEENLTAFTTAPDGTLERVNQTFPNSISQSEDVHRYYTGNIYSTYLFDVRENHNFKFLLGYQFELNDSQFIGGRRFDLVSQSTPSFSTATGDQRLFDSKGHWATEGVFTRLNYDYKEKYLFEINARYDGTSRFAVGEKYGLFPSLSAGWNIHMEDFWEPIEGTVNELKVRASWGQLGNHNVPSYQDLPLIGIQSNLNWLIKGNRPTFVTAPNLTSPNLTWETAETINFGLDIGLLDNQLMASFDVYERTTNNMLGPAQALPATLGANQPSTNNATLRTRGWELSLNWRDVINRDLSYSARLILSDYEDVVTDFFNPDNSLTTFYEGMVLGEIWGYETDGLFQSQDEIDNHADQSFLFGDWNKGDVKYRDLNGDGVINRGDNTADNPGDRRIIGNSTPRYQFGIDLNLQFKNFQITTFWQGTAKRDAAVGQPNASWYFGFRTPVQNNLFTNHLDYYRDQDATQYAGLGKNTDAFFPRPYQNGAQNRKNHQVQTRFTESAAYVRLKHAQIRYDVPTNLSQRVGITNVSIYVTGENLFTFTSLQDGFDPDTAGLGQFGVGKSYFLQRTFALGLDLSF